MADIQKRIIKLIDKTQGEPFWEMDKPLFKEALYEFFDTFGIEEDLLYLDVTSSKKYNDALGVEKIEAVVKIINQSLQLDVTAFFEGKWYFSFGSLSEIKQEKETVVRIIPIETEMIHDVNGVACVFYIYDQQSSDIELFAIPVNVAERINIRQYDNEDISQDEDFLGEIDQYKLPYFISHNGA